MQLLIFSTCTPGPAKLSIINIIISNTDNKVHIDPITNRDYSNQIRKLVVCMFNIDSEMHVTAHAFSR